MKKDLLIKLAKMVMNLSEITINDKTWYVDGELAVGSEITDEEGVVIEDGEYTVDGKKVTVVEGKVTEIETIEEEKIEPETEDVKVEIEQEEETQEDVVPEKDEKDLRIEELEGLLKDRDAIIEELNAKIAELENKVKEPVEEPIKMNKVESDSVKRNPALKYFQN